ncbi:MAG: glycosyltransferase, partial [Acidimicrobiales bacterium]|nr:glycosyltransferase [Acidimicrobiales bacterium]
MTYEHFNAWRLEAASARPELSVVIPAYNEARRIVPTIAAIAAHLTGRGVDFEIIVSDDGSTDGTARTARSLGLRNLRVLAPGVNRGKGAATRAGVEAASGRRVLFTDADLSTPIEHVDEMLALVDAGTPVVIGSRATAGATVNDKSRLRHLLSSVLALLTRMVLGLRISDTQCGFKLFDRDAAMSLFSQQRIRGFSFDLELLYLAQRDGLDVAEVPVDWYDAPGSKVQPVRTTLGFLRDLVRIRFVHRRTNGSTGAARRVAVVTAMPPSPTTLNEYGFHLTRHLAAHPDVEEVIAFTEDGAVAAPLGVRVASCWRFDSMLTPLRILRQARRDRPDVVVFNLHFTSFGGRRVPAAVGLFTPALLRLFGHRTLVILHNLVDTVDLESAGFGSNRLVNGLMRRIGSALTRVVLLADKVSTTMPTYVDILQDRYGATNVYLGPHGVFDELPFTSAAPVDSR